MTENANPNEVATVLLQALKTQFAAAVGEKIYQQQPVHFTVDEINSHIDAIQTALQDLFPDAAEMEMSPLNTETIDSSRNTIAAAFYQEYLPNNKEVIRAIKAGQQSLIPEIVQWLKAGPCKSSTAPDIYETVFNIITYGIADEI